MAGKASRLTKLVIPSPPRVNRPKPRVLDRAGLPAYAGGMDMPRLHDLAQTIATVLDQGLPQDTATAQCLTSTLGPLAPAALAARLDDPDDDEAGPLRELLLFPGRETALALEPALAAADCDATDVPGLAGALTALVGQVRILLPDQPPLRLTVTPPELACLLTRLRPDRTAPAALRRTLTERFAPQRALDLAVACRQADLDWSRPRESFLTALLNRLDPETPESPDAVRFALRFLGDLAPGTPPLAALPRLRERLASQLSRAKVQETTLAGSNFETLAMTGLRLPYLHAPDIARELALLDLVLLAVTGRSGAAQAAVSRDLGTVDDVSDLIAALGGLED